MIRIATRTAAVIAAALGALALGAPAASAKPAPAKAAPAKARILTVTELPAGWTATHSSSKGGLTTSKCLGTLKKPLKHGSHATAAFTSNSGLPVLDELVVTGRGVKARYRLIVKRLDRCGSLSFTSNGKTLHATLGRMSFPAVGVPSGAYSLGMTIDKLHVGFDLVLFDAGPYVGLVGFGDLGTPTISAVERFVKAAVVKAQGKPVHLDTTATGTGSTATPGPSATG